MDPVLAMGATEKCGLLLLFTAVVAPLAGLLFRRVGAGWESIGAGPLAMEHDPPPQQGPGAPAGTDPGMAALLGLGDEEDAAWREAREAEVRQMLQAKADRQERNGEARIDVEAEVEKLLRPRRGWGIS